jgi:hypothetical protein
VTGDLTANLGHPKAVLLGEDLFLAARQMDVSQRLPEGVGHLCQCEAFLPVRAQEYDLGHRDALTRDHVAPRVMRLLLDRGVNGAFEGEIVGERRVTHSGGARRRERGDEKREPLQSGGAGKR